VLVGLISTLAGSALQEDIASLAHQLRRKGQDIGVWGATELRMALRRSVLWTVPSSRV
jgi:hypothetical protein